MNFPTLWAKSPNGAAIILLNCLFLWSRTHSSPDFSKFIPRFDLSLETGAPILEKWKRTVRRLSSTSILELINFLNEGTWGDELTLRAVCDAFGVVVHLITTETTNWFSLSPSLSLSLSLSSAQPDFVESYYEREREVELRAE